MRPVIKLFGSLAVVTCLGATSSLAQTAGGYLLGSSSSNNTTINYGGWSITLNACNVLPAGGTATACNGTQDEVIPIVSGATLSLVFESNTGGALESLTAGQNADLSFQSIAVTAPTSVLIDNSSVNITGSQGGGASGDGSKLSVYEGTIGFAGPTGAKTTLGTSPTLQSVAFTPVSSVTVYGTDIGAHGAVLTSGQTLTTSTATIAFNVPEPVSTSVLSVGLAALGLIRRKSRRCG